MKIKAGVSTGYVGSHREKVLEIDDEDLEGLSQDEKDAICQEVAEQWLWNTINFGWSEVEEA